MAIKTILKNMTIGNLLISAILIFSCEKEAGQIDTLDHLLTKERLESSFIQLIPYKGILLYSDSILLGKTDIEDLLGKLDTNSIKCVLTVDSPRQLVVESQGSPPPKDNGESGYTEDYEPTPDEYFTDYSATLKCDSLTFSFHYTSQGKTVLDNDIYMDSLKICSISIRKPLNAGLFEDLKIGDSYEQIFKHFKKPGYLYEADMIRKEIKYTGIVFTIETNKSQMENYGRIIKIEVNRQTTY